MCENHIITISHGWFSVVTAGKVQILSLQLIYVRAFGHLHGHAHPS